MRDRRRTPFGGVQAEKQLRYVRLIAQGVNNSEACRLVGINRKTGNRWRYGRSVLNTVGEPVHYPPVKITPAKTRSPRYLSELERIVIADLLRAGRSARGIALELGRSPSTVSREIARNSDSHGRYRPHHAEHAARVRAQKPRKRRIAGDEVLRHFVTRLLDKRWSPEQVAHQLRIFFAGQPSRWLCTESIYQALYDPAVCLTRPARRRRRRRRLLGVQRRGRLTAMTMIDQRPAEVEDRVQAGHWEGDLIMGPGNRSAIGTLVERTTRFLVLLHMPEGVPTTATVRQAVSSTFGALPEGLARTLTWDQGKELALHQQITAATGTRVFFCDAHAPWQRGSNENMNGLLRDYFPKGTDLSVHSAQELARVAIEINERPRKTLGWNRPTDLFDSALASVRPGCAAAVGDLLETSGVQKPELEGPTGDAAAGISLRSPPARFAKSRRDLNPQSGPASTGAGNPRSTGLDAPRSDRPGPPDLLTAHHAITGTDSGRITIPSSICCNVEWNLHHRAGASASHHSQDAPYRRLRGWGSRVRHRRTTWATQRAHLSRPVAGLRQPAHVAASRLHGSRLRGGRFRNFAEVVAEHSARSGRLRLPQSTKGSDPAPGSTWPVDGETGHVGAEG